MQKQRIILLIVGVVLAVVVVFLIKVYLDQQRQQAEEEAQRKAVKLQQSQTSVLVARQDIPKGTAITSELLTPKIVPKEYVVPQAVTSLDRISGMVTVAPIAKDEQIALSKLMLPREAHTGGGLAEATPVGKRAITINVDNITASVGGMVKPGDYVDIIASLPVPSVTADGKQITQVATVPLFQNVLILAVGQQISAFTAAPEAGGATRYGSPQQPQAQPQTSSLITLALSPQEASLAAFAQEQGKLRLVLRSPADSQMQPLRPVGWEALFQYLMPKDVQATVKPAAKPEEPSEYVEVYRGLKKEKVPLSK